MRSHFFSFAFLLGSSLFLLACGGKDNDAVSCSAVDESYICFSGDGRKATYNRWNFDTTGVVKTLNIQGSDPAVPGTEGPWTTITISMVNSNNSIGIETGVYNYWPVLADDSTRQFTFWIKRYIGDPKDPDFINYTKAPDHGASLNIESVSGSGEITGVLTATVYNPFDPLILSEIKYRFYNIKPQ